MDEIIPDLLMKGAGPIDLWHQIAILSGFGVAVLAVAVQQYSKTKG